VRWILPILLACGEPQEVEQPPVEVAPRPNVVLILADDMGVGDAPPWGAAFPTPSLNAIARDGVVFERAYSTSPVCGPSRAGLFTGMAPQRSGMEFNPTPVDDAHVNRWGLPPSAYHMAEMFKDEGYATALVGKWHLGTHPDLTPRQQGYDHFYGFLHGAHPYMPRDLSDTDPRIILQEDGDPIPMTDYLTFQLADHAEEWIAEHKDDPFFLTLAFNAPHTPLEAPIEWLERTSPEFSRDRRIYQAMVMAMDHAIGELGQTLIDLGIDDNTLIIFTSDNGAERHGLTGSNDPFRFGKLMLFEGGVRVPLLLRWPGAKETDPVRAMVSQLDLMPTLATAIGAPLRPDWDGTPLQREGARLGERSLFFRLGPNVAVIQRDGKWIGNPYHDWVFDLEADPTEDVNMVDGGIPETMEQALQEWEDQLPAQLWEGHQHQSEPDEWVDGYRYPLWF